MNQILVLTSSVSGDASVSDRLVQQAVRELQQAHPGARVIHRDLARHPLPHLTPENVGGIRGEPASPEERAARALSDALVAELMSVSAIVIGAPMYNFSVPTTLRAWFDHVLRPGVTFTYAGGSPRGLVGDKPVFIVEARGGVYSEGPAVDQDFQEPYLRQLLGFIGLTDLRFIRAEKIGFGADAREASIQSALAAIRREVAPAGLAA